jgi:hypothetical protein
MEKFAFWDDQTVLVYLPFALCLWSHPLQLLNELNDFNDTLYGRHVIRGHTNFIRLSFL